LEPILDSHGRDANYRVLISISAEAQNEIIRAGARHGRRPLREGPSSCILTAAIAPDGIPGDMPMIQTRPLFDIQLQVPTVLDIGETPLGRRRIATVTGGEFHGERLRGTVVGAPAGDWLLQRHDGVTVLDVRLVLRTDDGEHIYMSYRGVRHGPAEVMARLAAGESVDPGSYYFRIAPVFETAAKKYEWINKIVAVGTGRREPTGPIYSIEEIL
jgi:hypothetical protein